MVKLGKLFSIFLVLTLLILLAPALVLTGQNVGAQGEAVTEEIEAICTFTEASGQWWPFTAGSGGVQAPGPDLEQYTRNRVIAGVEVPGCAFRNYTAGSGNVTSTTGDLNGTVTLEWITVAFPGAYPYTPKYATADNYGWMMGRGHYYDEGSPASNFTFGFVLDWDGEAEMANAVGKGVMTSANETGRFGEILDPQELRHKVIGDFDVVKTGAVYTWNLHLRNYPPNEIYNNSILLVDGGVLQENTDPITTGVDLVNFLADGPHPTPLDLATSFEEVTFGRDPAKTITAGYLGVGGIMDVSRNTILYLEVNAGANYVRIQGTTCNHIYINDTYAVTGDDGSMYGEQNELLLLYIHDQKLNITEYFYQYGYTFTPFGLNAPCTDCYLGKETFADAGIAIESSVGAAAQESTDVVFGLYPHPKVASVVPAIGSPDTTMDVTISGKYFLRADDFAPTSGSVDFGAGITVNSYTIDTYNPIGNTITASITIDPLASLGARDVNVTSCFGYSNGNGTAPYKSGLGVFTVAGGDAVLEGHVSFKSRGTAPDARWIEPFAVRCFQEGNLDNELWSQTATTDNNGVFTIIGLTPGTYDIGLKNSTGLSELSTSVTLVSNSTIVVDFGEIREGDSDGNDAITILDFSKLAACFGTSPAGNPNCDFDRNDAITILDFSLLAGNFGQAGPLQGY